MLIEQEIQQINSKKERLVQKWKPLLEMEGLPAIKSFERKAIVAQMLESQHNFNKISGGDMLGEAAHANQSGAFPTNTNLKGYDPILISLVRRAMPNLLSTDLMGNQPMSGPTGLVFALRAKYSTQGGTEALYDEANTVFSGTGTQAGTTPAGQTGANDYKPGTAMDTADGEALGTSGGGTMAEMAISIDKVTATAKTRALKAEWTMEIQQDLKNVHGLDAESELMNILSTEINTEMNREFIRRIYNNAKKGAQHNTAVAGEFDLDADSNGRWMEEKIKGLMFQLEREANHIAKDTRRGRGNNILCSSDVASALSIAGLLDDSKLEDSLSHDGDTQNTFVGTLNKRFKVFVDPYVPSAALNYACIVYKGNNEMDAGIYFCPYVPLELSRAIDPSSFQPKMGFRTRYAVVSNPFATSTIDGALTYNTNKYMRIIDIKNLM
jgi:hypothetical protein